MGARTGAVAAQTLVLLLGAASSVRGNGPSGTVPDFSQTQKALEAPKPPCCADGQRTWYQKLTKADFSSCLTRICGKPGSVLNQLTYDAKLREDAKSIDGEVRARLEPILKKWGDAYRKSDLRDIDDSLAYLKKGQGPKSEKIKRFLGIMNLYNAIGKFQSRTLKDGEATPKDADGNVDYAALVDEKKTRTAIKDLRLSDNEFKELLAIYRKAAVQYAAAPENDASTKDQVEAILIEKYKKSLRDSLIAQLQDNMKSNDEGNILFEKHFGFAVPKSMTKGDQDRIQALIDFVKDSSGLPLPLVKQAESEASENSAADTFYGLMEDPVNPLVAKLGAQDWTRKIQPLVKNLRGQKAFLNSPAFRKKLSTQLDLCLSKMSLAAAAYPKKERRAAFVERVNAIRSSVDKSFKGILSDHTAGVWKDSVAKVDLIVPPTREEWLAFAEKYFVSKAAEAADDSDEADSRELERRVPDSPWLGLTEDLFPDADKKPTPVLDSVEEACKLYEPEDAVRDYNLTSQNAIVLSAYSIVDDKAGPAIVAHELGHSLANVFTKGEASAESSKWYEGAKSCVEAWHPEAAEWPGATAVNGDPSPTFNFEEDFADEVSHHLTGDSSAMGCALTLTDGGKYVGNDGVAEHPYTAATFLNEDKDDEHSSGVFRALHMYWDAHHDFPAECKASLEESGLPQSWKNCF